MAYLDQMNVKANEQDTVGTDYDLRDKDLNAATATTSVASTDGVVLKGTDGSYHTIDKSSFTEAVRSVIGGILNNMTSKGTAVKGVSVIDNSNDFGLTTPSDLASVLGVGNIGKVISGDLNDIPSGLGFYYQNNSTVINQMTNKPTGFSAGEMQLINVVFDKYGMQFFFASNVSRMWARSRSNSSWSAWKEITLT